MKIDFSRYSPQELRDQTEIEFQKCGDAKQAVYNALAFLNNMYGVSDMQKATQLEIGTKIESEHKDTFKFIKDYKKKHGEYPPEEMVYKQIAKDHLSEFKDYYTRLIAMEKQAEQEMSKAKYIKKIPDGKGGWKYFYAEPKDKKERNIEEKKESKSNILREMLPSYYNYTEKDLKRITDLLPDNNFFATKEESYNDNNWSEENTTGYKEYEVKNGKMFFGLDGVQELQKDIPSPEYPYFFRATNNTKEPELGDFKSTNYVTGQKEKGMSVSPHPRYAVFNNLKHLYAVTGEIAGYGSDGEPLLTNVKFLKKLNIKEAEKEHTIKKLESGIKFLKDKGMNDSGKILNVLMRLKGYNLESSESLQKAKKDLTKLIKKVIINSKGVQQTVYTLPEGAKTEWLNKFMQFFNFKDSRQANQKLEADYKANNLDKKGVTWQQWKDHVSEYFNNKDKWDRFFNKSTEQKKETAKKEEQKAKKSNKKPKTAVYKLSLMKFIAGMYGKAPEKVKEDIKEKEREKRRLENKVSKEELKNVSEKLKNQFGKEEFPSNVSDLYNHPNFPYITTQLINEGFLTVSREVNGNLLYKVSENNFETMPESEEDILNRLNIKTNKDAILYVKNKSKEYGTQRDYLKTDEYKKLYPIFKKLYDKEQEELKRKKIEEREKNKVKIDLEHLIQDQQETKDKPVEPETPEQKTEDKKFAQRINDARPDNRNWVEREITGVTEQEAEKVDIPKIEFKPKSNNVTIPMFQGGNPQVVPVWDYSDVTPKDIYLVKEKNILTADRPSYIPEIDETFFAENKYFIPTVKLGENKYFIQTHKRRTVYEGRGAEVQGNNYYVVVTRDVLASMQDYYLKKAKILKKQEVESYKQRTGRTPRSGTRISMIAENKMTYPQMNFIQSFVGGGRYDNHAAWVMYKQIRQDLKQKTEDMEIQLEEYENTHAKGRETAYGDKGLKDNLLKDYGVKVKRQNGAEITNEEIGEIKSALDTVYSVFGDRKSMAQNFGLKISHAGDVRMHARKAVGLFIPRMKAIGVTAKYGDKGTGFILAHEWGHFMDYYVGNKNGRHYMSDDPEHAAGQIAETFRSSMAKKQTSKYQTRTCECFARAMEQYWAIKTDNKELMAEWDMGNHPTEDKFKERVMPLIDKFLTENEELLKAFHKEFDNNKKVFIKKKNPLTGKFEYRKVKK